MTNGTPFPPISKAELDSYFVVRYTPHDSKERRFGVVHGYDDETKKYAKRGQLVVSDAETAERSAQMPSEVEKVDVWDGDHSFHKWLDGKYMEAAKRALKSKTLKDQILRFTVCDGSAYYVVTKVTKTTMTVEWRGWSGLDEYTDRMLGYGETVPRRMLEDQIESKELLRHWIEYHEKKHATA